MLVVCVMNGWSASSRGRTTRTAHMVDRLTRPYDRVMLGRKSLLFAAGARRFRRFITHHQSLHNELFVVGKSLGARNLVKHVLNKLPSPLVYRRSALVTIDPCWVANGSLRPNLNRSVLQLENEIDFALNFVAIRPENEQAGALLDGPNVFNDLVTDYDHFSMTEAPQVALGLHAAIGFLRA